MTFEDTASVFCLLSFSFFTFSIVGKFHSIHCCCKFCTLLSCLYSATGCFSFESAFFHSTAFVLDGQFFQISCGIVVKAGLSIFKCCFLVHHSDHALAISQQHACFSTSFASSCVIPWTRPFIFLLLHNASKHFMTSDCFSCLGMEAAILLNTLLSTALWNGSDDITRFQILTQKHPLNQASSEQFWCKLLTNSCLQSFTLCIRPINHDSHKCTTQWELGAVFGGLFKCIGLFNLNNTSTTIAITRYAKADGSLTMVIVLTGGYICLQLANDHMLHQWQYYIGRTEGWSATTRETKRQHFSSLTEMVMVYLCLSPKLSW